MFCDMTFDLLNKLFLCVYAVKYSPKVNQTTYQNNLEYQLIGRFFMQPVKLCLLCTRTNLEEYFLLFMHLCLYPRHK